MQASKHRAAYSRYSICRQLDRNHRPLVEPVDAGRQIMVDYAVDYEPVGGRQVALLVLTRSS